MKPVIIALNIVMTAAVGCSNKQPVAPSAPGPNMVEKHEPTACPMLNGSYADANGNLKTLKTSYDQRNNLVLQDGPNNFWILNGLPQYQTGNRSGSYTAYCTSQLLSGTDQNLSTDTDGTAASANTIVVVVLLQNGKPFQDIQYIPATQLKSSNSSQTTGVVFYVSQPGDDSQVIQNDLYFSGQR